MAFTLLITLWCIYLYLSSLISNCHCVPNENKWTVEVNYYFIYSQYKSVDLPFYSEECSKHVLQAILKENKISEDLVDLQYSIKPLLSKILRLQSKAKKIKSKGGRQMQELLEDWKTQSYTVPLSVSNLKRKLEDDVKCEQNKRQKLDDNIAVLKTKVQNLENVVRKLSGTQFALGKKKYGKKWTKPKVRSFKKHADACFTLLDCYGFSPRQVTVTDQYGNIIQAGDPVTTSRDELKTIDVDTILLVKDQFKISDQAYLKLASNSNMPSLKKVKSRSCELNSLYHIKYFPNCIGVYEKLSSKLPRVIDQLLIRNNGNSKGLFLEGTVSVRISGDGTWVGKRLHLVNFTFAVVLPGYTSGNHLWAIAKVQENHKVLADILSPLSQEVQNLTEILLNGTKLKVQYFLAGDMKFLNVVVGIGACSSKYACLWCTCSATERGNVSKVWSMFETDKGARTVADIEKLSRQKKDNFSCQACPIFPSIPITFVVPDILHLYLRISDQLTNQLIVELMKLDKINKNAKKFDRTKQNHLAKFEKFISDLGIEWSFYIDKESSLLKYRDFTGPEHRKIQTSINLLDLLPSDQNLHKIVKLWEDFSKLMEMLKKKMPSDADANECSERARKWVSLYGEVYMYKNITPYMHVLMNHFPESMKFHGNLNLFCMQGVEKMNSEVTQWYFRSTNHHSLQSLQQIMEKQSRIEILSSKCSLKKFEISCGCCGKQGHNKRTCPNKLL